MSLRSPSRAFLLPLALTLLCATGAPAQDALHIDAFHYLRRPVHVAPKGRSLTLLVRGLPAVPVAPAEVRVQVGAQDAQVDDVTAQHVTITVPADAPIGPTRVRVTVQGRRAEAAIEVVEANHEDILAIENDMELGGGGQDEQDRVRGLIRIERFVVVRDAAGERFEVEVATGPLPDGARLDLALALAEPRVPLPALSMRLIARGGKATGSLRTSPRRAAPGDHVATVIFDGTKQPSAVARWILTQSREAQEAWGRIEKTADVRIGTDEELAAHRAEVRDHLRAVADEAQRLLVEVDRAYASASRSLFVDPGKPKGWDEVAWRAHVAGLAPRPADIDAFAADARFTTPRGHLKPAELEAWTDGTLLPALRALDERRRSFAEGWLAPPMPKAEAISTALVAFVGQRLVRHARALYTRARVELPALFADPPGASAPGPEDRAAFLAQRRLLLRAIGQGDVADAEAAR